MEFNKSYNIYYIIFRVDSIVYEHCLPNIKRTWVVRDIVRNFHPVICPVTTCTPDISGNGPGHAKCSGQPILRRFRNYHLRRFQNYRLRRFRIIV